MGDRGPMTDIFKDIRNLREKHGISWGRLQKFVEITAESDVRAKLLMSKAGFKGGADY